LPSILGRSRYQVTISNANLFNCKFPLVQGFLFLFPFADSIINFFFLINFVYSRFFFLLRILLESYLYFKNSWNSLYLNVPFMKCTIQQLVITAFKNLNFLIHHKDANKWFQEFFYLLFFFQLKEAGGQVITFWCLVNEITKARFGLCFFRNPNLREKKQVKKKIFDNFLNFVLKFSLCVTIWNNLSRWIVYMALKLSTMHLINDVIFKFYGKDYFVKFIQR